MIYLDNAATTKVDDCVLQEMLPYFTEDYGNPSSVYSFSRKSADAVEHTREVIAQAINAKPEEIYFTSGASEANNWILRKVVELVGERLATSTIEHHSVLNTCKDLEKHGYSVYYINVNENGIVSKDEIEETVFAYDPDCVSIMAANNEIGTIQPLKEIGEFLDKKAIFFHTDATQAFGHIPIDVRECKIDFLSASAHKFGGPKGIGFAYIKKDCNINPLIYGGSQERNKRAGTLNVPGIVGMGKAVEICMDEMKERAEYETKLRDHLIDRVLDEIPNSKLNGSRKNRLPNNANFCFEGVSGEALLMMLDGAGICVSSGSACTAGNGEPSHVLKAIGLTDEQARSSIRMTLSHENTLEEIDYVVDKLKQFVGRLRIL